MSVGCLFKLISYVVISLKNTMIKKNLKYGVYKKAFKVVQLKALCFVETFVFWNA